MASDVTYNLKQVQQNFKNENHSFTSYVTNMHKEIVVFDWLINGKLPTI